MANSHISPFMTRMTPIFKRSSRSVTRTSGRAYRPRSCATSSTTSGRSRRSCYTAATCCSTRSSLVVMTSREDKERLKRQVQAIYIHPRYGIKSGSGGLSSGPRNPVFVEPFTSISPASKE